MTIVFLSEVSEYNKGERKVGFTVDKIGYVPVCSEKKILFTKREQND
jgi:hypothetical protein